MAERVADMVEKVRKKLREGGNGGGISGMPDQVLFVPKDGVRRVRFLSDFNEMIEIVMHDAYGKFFPQPCLRYYGKKCPFHVSAVRTGEQYAWTVYDYDAEARRIFISKATANSAMEDLMELFDENGTLKDRDIKLKRVGTGKKSKYKARGAASASDFEGSKRNPFSRDKVFEIVKGMIQKVRLEDVEEDEDEDEKDDGGDDDE